MASFISNQGIWLVLMKEICIYPGNQVEQKLIVVLGECCPGLTTLHLSTAAIEGDELLSNPGQLFSDLTVLHLQVWEESVLSSNSLLFCKSYDHEYSVVITITNTIRHLTVMWE